MSEAFQPIPVRPPSEARALFAFRCMLDFQLLTIYRFLRPELLAFRGRVLDAGAGEAPWRELLAHVEYVGIDVDEAAGFGMRRTPNIVYYDGRKIPFPDSSFDHVLCVEVLEHVPDPAAFVTELARVLRTGGSLVLTIPWSARLHHLPHDYGRFTRYGLRALLNAGGFTNVRIDERGNDVAVIANKLLVMTIALLRPWRGMRSLWRWPLAVIAAPIALAFTITAHVALACRLGSNDDPLGYGAVAIKA